VDTHCAQAVSWQRKHVMGRCRVRLSVHVQMSQILDIVVGDASVILGFGKKYRTDYNCVLIIEK